MNAQVLQFLQQADKFYARAQAELKAGRLDLYYQDILKMKAALDQARSAAKPTKTGPARLGFSDTFAVAKRVGVRVALAVRLASACLQAGSLCSAESGKGGACRATSHRARA